MTRQDIKPPIIIDLETISYHPIFLLDHGRGAAESIDLSKVRLKNGTPLSMLLARLKSAVECEYYDLMDGVEIFCEENCRLEGTYRFINDAQSQGYNYLANDKDGHHIIIFRNRLRVSGQAPKSEAQQGTDGHNNAPKTLDEILQAIETFGYKQKSIYIVNNTEFYDCDFDVLERLFEIIENTAKPVWSECNGT